jgi:FKBP-type peptidyl-prolyl cis-trans isomerase (trigger factor)
MVMQSNGLTRAQLLSQMGTDEKGYIKERTEYAEKIVKEELILYEIIQAEEIRVSSDEYKSKGATLAKEGDYGDTVKDLENALGEDVAERTIIWEKVKEYILSKAIWTV